MSRTGCTCDPSGRSYCPRCAYALSREVRGRAQRAVDAPSLPQVKTSPSEAGGKSQEREGRFMARVMALAKGHGWLCYHTRDSRHSPAGFPDLVLARPWSSTSRGRLLFAELKSRQGKVTQEQAVWIDVLRHTISEVDVRVWKPSDWPEIVAYFIKES